MWGNHTKEQECGGHYRILLKKKNQNSADLRHHLWPKNLSKLGKEPTFLNFMKSTLKNPVVNIIVKGQMLNIFPSSKKSKTFIVIFVKILLKFPSSIVK